MPPIPHFGVSPAFAKLRRIGSFTARPSRPTAFPSPYIQIDMKTSLVRVVAVFAIATLAACGSDEAGAARLKGLKEGMTLQEAVAEMGQGPLTATYADTARLINGYRRMTFYMNGTTYQVVYAREIPGDVKEPVLQAKETPVVFRNDTLMGWGWKYYVSDAIGKFQLPTPLKAVDTMTTIAPPDTANQAGKQVPAAPPVDSTAKDTTKKS